MMAEAKNQDDRKIWVTFPDGSTRLISKPGVTIAGKAPIAVVLIWVENPFRPEDKACPRSKDGQWEVLATPLSDRGLRTIRDVYRFREIMVMRVEEATKTAVSVRYNFNRKEG